VANAQIGALRIMLSMEAGEFLRTSDKAIKELDEFDRALKRLDNQISNASFSFNSGMMAANRFANVIRGIITTSSEFGSGMSAVSTLVDTSTNSMRELSESVLDIGRRTPVAVNEMTTALYDLLSAGTDISDSMHLLERSAQLAVAAVGTTGEAVDIVTSSINAFGLKGQEIEKLFDNIFKATAYGKMTISDLARGFGAVAGTVASAGIKLDEYLSSVAALTTTGLPAAEAHTQIRAAIAGLTRESELGKKAMQAFGVKTFAELIEKSGGLVGALTNVKTAFGGNAANLIKLLGSVEAYNALIGLTGKQNEVYKKSLDDMRNGEEGVGKAFQKRNDDMTAALKKLSNTIVDMGVALGEAVTPLIVDVQEALSGLVDWFRSLDTETQQFIARWGAIITLGVPAAAAIVFFANALGALIPVISTLGVIIGGLIAAAGPIGMFVAVAGAAVTAWQIWHDEIISIFSRVATWIGEKVGEILGYVTKLGDSVSNMWARMTGSADQATDHMTTFVEVTDQAFNNVEMKTGLVSKMWETAKKARDDYRYSGATITGDDDKENKQLREKNSLLREATQIFNENSTVLEKFSDTQAKVNGLYNQGAIDATTASRAMQKAAMIVSNAYASAAAGIASDLGKVFEGNKAVAIATALINTYQAVTNAWANVPWPLNIAAAAAALAAGMTQVANIKKTSKGSSSGSGDSGGGGGGGGSSGPTAAPQQLMVQGISADHFYKGDAVRGLADTLLEYQRNGGRVILQST
jgi:TP901 family phage tail tape measure protein